LTGDRRPAAGSRTVGELALRAAFQEEHGAGVLSDGERAPGIGPSDDAGP